MKTRRFRRFGFERLESRNLMAGQVLVSVVSGDLIVTGDNNDNDIEITALTTGSYQITANNGTTLVVTGNANVSSTTVTGATRDVLIDMKQGSDTVKVDHAVIPLSQSASSVAIPSLVGRNIAVKMGSGTPISGTTGSLNTTGALSIDGGNIGGSVTITIGTPLDPLATPTGANPGNTANVQLTGLTVRGSVNITSQQVVEEIGLSRNSIYGNLNLQNTGASASVALRKTNIAGSAAINLGVNNTVAQPNSLGISSSVIAGYIAIWSGKGDDYIGLGKDSSITAAIDSVFGSNAEDGIDGITQILGDIYMATGDGSNLIDIANVGVANSTYIVAGSGDDIIQVQQLSLGKDFSLNGGNGNNHVSITGLAAKNLYTALGSGDDSVTISQTNISKTVNVAAGAGSNSLSLTGDNSFPKKKWLIFKKTTFSDFNG